MAIGESVFGSWELVSLDDITAAEQHERHQDALTWILAYVNEHPGTAKTKVAKAFYDHYGRGGRTLAEKTIATALTGSTPTLTKGHGKSPNGTYLYPASEANLPLPDSATGSTGSTDLGPSESEDFPSSRPLRRAGEREVPSEGDSDQIEIERLLEKAADTASPDDDIPF